MLYGRRDGGVISRHRQESDNDPKLTGEGRRQEHWITSIANDVAKIFRWSRLPGEAVAIPQTGVE